MSNMQEENNKETAKEKSKRRMAPQTLEDKEAKSTGWRVSFKEQDDKSVVVQIACPSIDRDWYRITARIPKSKLKRL